LKLITPKKQALPHIVAFIIPNSSPKNNISAFQSSFEYNNDAWVLKSIIGVKGSLYTTITKNQATWVIEGASSPFEDKNKAVLNLIKDGFEIVGFVYFSDNNKKYIDKIDIRIDDESEKIKLKSFNGSRISSVCLNEEKIQDKIFNFVKESNNTYSKFKRPSPTVFISNKNTISRQNSINFEKLPFKNQNLDFKNIPNLRKNPPPNKEHGHNLMSPRLNYNLETQESNKLLNNFANINAPPPLNYNLETQESNKLLNNFANINVPPPLNYNLEIQELNKLLSNVPNTNVPPQLNYNPENKPPPLFQTTTESPEHLKYEHMVNNIPPPLNLVGQTGNLWDKTPPPLNQFDRYNPTEESPSSSNFESPEQANFKDVNSENKIFKSSGEYIPKSSSVIDDLLNYENQDKIEANLNENNKAYGDDPILNFYNEENKNIYSYGYNNSADYMYGAGYNNPVYEANFLNNRAEPPNTGDIKSPFYDGSGINTSTEGLPRWKCATCNSVFYNFTSDCPNGCE
jgi:hypothetical protein